MTRSAPSILTMLEAVKEQFDEQSDSYKAELLDQLSGARFRTASQLERFHELLCFMGPIRTAPGYSSVQKVCCLLLIEFSLRAAGAHP